MKVVVTGAGGFIGHHLVKRLKAEGNWVRGVDIKYPEFEASVADEFQISDLRNFESCLRATDEMDDVYQLAADMGGIGYITANHAFLTRNNTLINSTCWRRLESRTSGDICTPAPPVSIPVSSRTVRT